MTRSMLIFDFQGTIAVNGSVFSGMEKIIPILAKDYMLCIVSASAKARIHRTLEEKNLLSFFTDIVSNETLTTKADAIRTLLRAYAVPKHRCILISDTHDDMETAKHLTITPIFVTWGIEPIPHDHRMLVAHNTAELFGLITHTLPAVDQEK